MTRSLVASAPDKIAPVAPVSVPPPDMHRLLGATQLPLSTARLVLGLTPIVLAELTADGGGGRSTYWFLDRRGRVLARDLAELPADLLQKMRLALLDASAAAARGAPQVLKQLLADLASLQRTFRLNLMRRLFEDDTVAPLSLLPRKLHGDDRDFERVVVRDEDGLSSIVVDGEFEFPVLMDRALAPSFMPGWSATAVVTCFLPLLMLRLQHINGTGTVWVLDRQLSRIDDSELATPQVCATIQAIAPALIRRLWQRTLDFTDDQPDPELAALFRLDALARRRIVDRCIGRMCLQVEELVLADIPDQLVLPPRADQDHPVVLQRAGIVKAVSQSLYDAGVAAVRTGRFIWPSPVDGSEAELEAVYPLQEHSILYQFRDTTGLRFLVLTAERDCMSLGIFIPSANLVLGEIYMPNQRFHGVVHGSVWHALLEHCLLRSDMLPNRRRRADSPIVNVFMGAPLLHIGHYVWNDLSGQLALLQNTPGQPPTSVVFGGSRGENELFGPLDELFPALVDRVDRTLADTDEFVRWVHQSGVVPIRFTKAYITRALRDVVRQATEGSAAYRYVSDEIARRYRDRPIIIVGLRLDDRTFVDNEAFHVGLLDHLSRTRPGAVIVFDGRNSKPGGRVGEMIEGMKDHLATIGPVTAEHALVERLQQRFSNSSLSIVSTIGQPTRTSMAWCYHACLCVAPWGAGLAKYRWLANLPSLILTSRFNIEQRPDLDIYQSPRWMEDPSELVYPDPTCVTDRIDMIGLTDSVMRIGRECFEVDLTHVCSLLDQMLDRHANRVTAPRQLVMTD